MSLFGSRDKHPNLTRITESLRAHLGLELTAPGDDVVANLEQMTSRELLHFDNLHSVEGMQELFRVRSLRAVVDTGMRVVQLSVATPADLEQEIVQEHSVRKVFHVAEQHTGQRIVHSHSAPMLGAKPAAAPVVTGPPAAPLTGALEHLEALERLLPQIVDLFLRHGRLNTGDKEVIRKILPTESTIEGRLAALERWQAEVSRRMRGLHVQRSGGSFLLASTEAADKPKLDETYARRFDAVMIWVSKLIKAFEHTGVKFHNKPMWLPH